MKSAVRTHTTTATASLRPLLVLACAVASIFFSYARLGAQEVTDSIAPLRVQKPLFALSTNMLHDIAITPNLMLEVPIGRRWSIYLEYTFPWWVNKKNTGAWQILKWDLGARFYPFFKYDESDPLDILRGHFFGIEFSGGYYDFEPKHTGYQGEFQIAGIEYGYSWRVARCWHIDLFIGAGWMGTHYRCYTGDANDEHLLYQYSGKLNWFGPTRFGVSAKCVIPYNRKVKGSKR